MSYDLPRLIEYHTAPKYMVAITMGTSGGTH